MTARRPQGKTYDGSKHTSPTLRPVGIIRLEPFSRSVGKGRYKWRSVGYKITVGPLPLPTAAPPSALSDKAAVLTSRRKVLKPSAGISGKGSVKSRSRKSSHEPQSARPE